MLPRRNKNKIIDKEFVWDFAKEHFTFLHQKYYHYFFTINREQYSWIRNSFLDNAEISTQELSLPVVKKTIFNYEMRQLRLKSSDVPPDEFWICIEGVYERVSEVSSEILQFCTTYCTCVNKVSHFCY